VSKVIVFKSRNLGAVKAQVDPSENPVTASKVLEALPLRGVARRWGDEVYFKVPLKLPPENARVEVKKGEVAYWPEGSCICVFFGRTPISPSDEDIRAYSPVNVFARIVGDPSVFSKVEEGERIAVELLK